jgi:hypothetical protein
MDRNCRGNTVFLGRALIGLLGSAYGLVGNLVRYARGVVTTILTPTTGMGIL